MCNDIKKYYFILDIILGRFGIDPVSKKDIDVNEHDILSNITLRHKVR